MKILYFCHTGVHSALVGAGIHLGLLPFDYSGVKKEDISRLPHFDGITASEIGTPFYVGKDELGNDVCVFGVNHEKAVFTSAVKELLQLYKINPNSYRVVDILQYNNRWISLGGFLSTFMGWNHLGRAMLLMGIRKAYGRIASEVSQVKAGLH